MNGFLGDVVEAAAEGCSSADDSDWSEAARLDAWAGGASWFSELCELLGPLGCDSYEG